jgi:xanthine dehydrogenase accessory factor
VYEVALTVAACLRAGTHVDVAWAVAVDGLGPGARHDPSEALALTPGGGRVGTLLGGALDAQLGELAAAGATGRLVDLVVSQVDALVAGVAPDARVRCLVVPAQDMPADLWERLLRREPVTVVTRLSGADVAAVELEPAAEGGAPVPGASSSAVTAEEVTTVLVPVPTIVVVGAGPFAGAVEAAASLVGWRVQTARDGATARGLVVGLAALDSVVVAAHDDDVAGPALQAALGTEVGYIGAVGPPRVQQSRADWLAYRGVTDLSRVHAPAGLDIGASTPPEVAVAVLAEAVAVHAGRSIAFVENPT